ncbi:MAG: ABC transporter permease [Gemmatales bacterium]|nr:ABC transporter permease [Gemmatales bacterium]MCS7159803.1 ABC transporter permease [Gemmatales bacterium]MDW8175002.1 ABC transporter permease [Gemmatales bacterium]MDW8223476.1 ABC transporter permease [Gemmatales bacterium]
MSLSSALRVALDALLVNKGRSLLTSLGIVIGIAAVIAMVAAGTGTREKLDERLNSVGKTLILIRATTRSSVGLMTTAQPFSVQDVQALREDSRLRRMLVGISESQFELVTATTPTSHCHTTATGGTPEIKEIRAWRLASGHFYTDADVRKAAAVCVLGDTVRKKLFPTTNPVGQNIRVHGITLQVIGVLAPKGRAPTGADQDDQIFLPITTLQEKIAHQRNVSVVVTAARDPAYLKPAEERIREILRQTRRIRTGMEDNFEVTSVQEMAQLAVYVTTALNVLTVVIASISLVVGGIGIMNIMLVSVTERTREIGIRMAVGARPKDIRNQFLIEAVVLALLGGLVGVLVGLGIALLLGFLLNWPVYVSPAAVALAFGVSAAVGIFFGYYPAAKASRLDPIEALRYE